MASSTQVPPRTDVPRDRAVAPVRSGHGWTTFAAVLFFTAAVFNTVYGISALAKDSYFSADELLFGDLSMWGVFYLCLAVLQLITGWLIVRRSSAGAVFGIGLAVIHGTIALLSIGAYPIWSLVMLAIDGLIVYALCVYGFDDV